MKLRPVEEMLEDVLARPDHGNAILFRGEPQLLYQYAKDSPGPIVEIGSFHGGGSTLLAKASRDGNGELVYSLDRHEMEGSNPHCECDPARDWKQWALTVLGAQAFDLVRPIGLWSHEALPAFQAAFGDGLGFLWIDGSHLFDDVARDAIDWIPLVRDDGFTAFHDCHLPGPRKVVEDLTSSGKYEIVGAAGTLAVLRRCP